MARRHYHVLAGMPGCMPDYNAPCTSRREAEREAAEYARDSREAYNQDYRTPQVRVTGSARNGWYDIIRKRGRDWELWQYIEIVDCCEDDCYEDGELWNE